MHALSRFLHLDINSYFATLEQQANPKLRGKPVGIVKDKGRTCIIAASKEAKLGGIKTGTNAYDAYKLCPNLILVPAQFDRYLASTKKLHAFLRNIAPRVEIFSLDEAFIDISDCQQMYPNSWRLAQQLQQGVFDTLGDWVTCNVGIAWNRFLAKMASETGSKGSITEVTQDNLDEYLLNTPFEAVCGIGMRLEKRLRALGIDNLYAINFVTDNFLIEHFGKHYARELRNMSQGKESHLLQLIDHLDHMKSVGRSITGWGLCDNEREIKRILYNITAEMCAKARKMGLEGRLIAVYMRGSGQSWGKHITLKHYTNHTHEVFGYIWNQLYGSWKRNFKVIKFGVYLGMLNYTYTQQLLPKWHTYESLYGAIDQINTKFGQHTVRSAVMQSDKVIYEEVTGFFGDKQYQFGFR